MRKILPRENIAMDKQRFPLWEHMQEEHGLLLLESQVDEIFQIVMECESPPFPTFWGRVAGVCVCILSAGVILWLLAWRFWG